MNELDQTLKGVVVAVPESRQLDVLANMIEKRGGEAFRCPLVSILDAPDPEPIECWLNDFNQLSCDVLVILTGEGIRRLVGFADRAQLKDKFIIALDQVEKITRGPKPGRALKELGLKSDRLAAAPTTDGMIDTLRTMDLQGKRIAVQLYGTDPNNKLMRFLKTQSVAEILPVAPYIYASELDESKVQQLIDKIINDSIDVMTFTSQPQLKRLLSVAKKRDQVEEFIAALNRMKVAAVGPVVAEQLKTAGIGVDIMPEQSFFMKPMIRKMVEVIGKDSSLKDVGLKNS